MITLQLGIAFIFIWFFNLIWMIREILKHTPNWKDHDVDTDEIIKNFMANTPLERMEMIHKIGEINPLIGLSAISMLLFAFII